MPSITTVPSENTEETSQSMCAVVKGYPIVIRNSDDPEKRFQIPFDAPLFHWYRTEDRDLQLTQYMEEKFQIPREKCAGSYQNGGCGAKYVPEGTAGRRKGGSGKDGADRRLCDSAGIQTLSE